VYISALSDRHVTVEDMAAEGDKVAVRLTFSGAHTGGLMGIPPTGKQVKVSAINIFHLVDGKAVEQWTNSDDLGMMQQLGVVPAPGQNKQA
jgi:predicted ester cyclase